MFIDQKTRRDLELFHTRNGTPGLFDLLNLTVTKGGEAALRSRFERPLSEGPAIRRVQDSLRFLSGRGWRLPGGPERVEAVTRYLHASWDAASERRGPAFWLESLWVSVRYRDLLRFARQGVADADRLLKDVGSWLEDVSEVSPPEDLERLAREARALVASIREGLGKVRWRPGAVFRQDRWLRKRRKVEMTRLLHILCELDALMAMARAVEEHGLVFPEIVDSPTFLLEGEGVFHLFLDDPVPNPVLVSESQRVLFLTGPNMAGKTTYLKAVSVATYMAHLGMGVPAAEFRLTPVDALYSSLAPEENLREGLSYFMAEVRRVREVAEAVSSGKRALVVFDEVFRGTNVKDAFDASHLVIQGFARTAGAGFIFSSHLVELAEVLKGEAGIRFHCFRGEIRDGRARYDFRLEEGVSSQRFGLQLLEQEGVPDLLPGPDG